MSDRDIVELLYLFGGLALEANGAAIRNACFRTVDGFRDAKRRAVVPIKQPRLPSSVLITVHFADAQHAEYCVVKALRSLDVICTDHHVAKHIADSRLFKGREVTSLRLKPHRRHSLAPFEIGGMEEPSLIWHKRLPLPAEIFDK
jgi:single-stranded DNA-specific DHH superfamily exonuclease